MRILINYCVDEQKRLKRNHAQREVQNGIGTFDERKVEIHMALERIEPKQRKVVFPKYFGDLTIKEIAVVLGYPEGTIKTWLYREVNNYQI